MDIVRLEVPENPILLILPIFVGTTMVFLGFSVTVDVPFGCLSPQEARSKEKAMMINAFFIWDDFRLQK